MNKRETTRTVCLVYSWHWPRSHWAQMTIYQQGQEMGEGQHLKKQMAVDILYFCDSKCEPQNSSSPSVPLIHHLLYWCHSQCQLCLRHSCPVHSLDDDTMGSLRVRHDWVTSLSLFTFMHWRRKWQPTPVFLPGESQGRRSLVGCHLWGRTESDTTEAI